MIQLSPDPFAPARPVPNYDDTTNPDKYVNPDTSPADEFDNPPWDDGKGLGQDRPDEEKDGPTSWQAVDLNAIATTIETPAVLRRDDGHALFYMRRLHWVAGEPESLKSWFVLCGIPDVLAQGGRVLVIDYEDDAGGFVERCTALGVDWHQAQQADQLRYLNPTEPIGGRDGTITRGGMAMADHLTWAPTYVIVDGVTAAMDLEGLDPLKNDHIARWLALVPKPLTRCGAAVVVVDHVTKSREDRGRWAIGGQHKLAAVDGAAFIVNAVRPGGRATGSAPVEGLSQVLLAKDRRGHLRGITDRTSLAAIADFAFTSYPDGGLTVQITAPGRGAINNHERTIVEHLAIYEGASKGDIRKLGNSDSMDEAVKALVANRHVEIRKVGVAHRHHLTLEAQTAWADAISKARGHQADGE